MPIEKTKSETLTVASSPKVGFVSLGRPKNLVDSEVMMGILTQSGAELTPRAEDADVIVVNTCSFIGSAQQESIDTILEMARHKTGGKAKRLVVAGCLVERFRSEIQKNIPEVDAVVGTGELETDSCRSGRCPCLPGLKPVPHFDVESVGCKAADLAGRRRSSTQPGSLCP